MRERGINQAFSMQLSLFSFMGASFLLVYAMGDAEPFIFRYLRADKGLP
jgi:hypothetical protein